MKRALVVRQGDIWLADLGQPIGSTAGFVRPVVVVQGDAVNASGLTTYLTVPMTANLRHAKVPTNLLLVPGATGLDREWVAQPTLLLAVADEQLLERIGALADGQLRRLFAKLDLVLGRQ